MNVVCGEFYGVSCGTWIAFWNGAIGATVAAVLGGVVALFVVRLTNAQQRHGVDRTVEVAAIADFVAAIEELEWALKFRLKEPQSFDPGSYVLLMRAAVTRLYMARVESKVVADVLLHWPEKMHNLVNNYRKALLMNAPFSKDIIKAIIGITTTATLNLPECLSRSRVHRKVGIDRLRDADNRLTAAVDYFEDLWETATPSPSATSKPMKSAELD